jgi:hypothetical protein
LLLCVRLSDTEVVVTRKQIRRWWRVVEAQEAAQDAVREQDAANPVRTETKTSPVPPSLSSSGHDTKDSSSPSSSRPTNSSESVHSPAAARARKYTNAWWLLLGLGSALVGGVLVYTLLRNRGLFSSPPREAAGPGEADRFLQPQPQGAAAGSGAHASARAPAGQEEHAYQSVE